MLEYLSNVYEFFLGKEFIVPLWELVVYVLVTSVCLLFGRHRVGLIIAYCGIFYWGFILNYYTFLGMLNNTSYGFLLYVFSGCLMIIMTVVGLFTGHKEH